MTRARDIASGADFSTGIDAGEVLPHIIPNTLYPAYRGLLEGNTTGRTFVDSGGTGHTIGASASSRVSHTAGLKKIGNTSLRFDGYNGDFLTIADHADFDRETGGDFTWEMWVNIDGYQTNYTTLLGSLDSDIRITIGPDSSTAPKFSIYGPWGSHLTTTTTLSLNTWHHFAYVRDNGTIRLYVNGVQEATLSNTSDIDPDLIRIGQYYNTTLFFKGNLDEIRFSDNARYTSGTTFTPSTTAFSSDGNTKLLIHSNESLVHSGAYGTAQSDGKSYFYTDVQGSREIKDPRIGGHFGSQRHKLKSLQLLEQETATHGNDVYSVDGREWLRVVGKNWQAKNTANGNFIYNEECNDGIEEYIEVTGYFNFLTHLDYTNPANGVIKLISVDGSADGTSQNSAGSDTPLSNRFVDTGSVNQINLSALSLGIHTVRFGFANDTMSYAIELIAQDTTSTATKSKIQIPSQNVVSYGKKFTVSGTPHYNPFDGMSGAKTLAQLGDYIDTATSLGMDNWKAGTANYYKPFNGGRVVRWVDSSGTIKTSVTMMPPNAQNVGGTASNAFSDGEVQAGTNDHTITFNTTAIDHSLSEVAKTFHYREFGNGAANGGASGSYADASMFVVGGDDIAYVMDDGLTSFLGADVRENGQLYHHETDGIYLTWIGTGLSYHSNTGYGAPNATWAQNLPYGTHILKILHYAAYAATNGEDHKLTLDGVVIADPLTVTHADTGVPYLGHPEFTLHQPKMPPIPEDAVIISDYMLMASYVQNTSATIGTISKGVRRIGGSRDHFYSCGGAIVAIGAGSFTYPWYWYGPGSHASNTMAVSLPYFGTSFTSFAEDQSQTHTFTLDGSAVTPTEADSDETRADLFYHAVSTLGQHTKIHTLPAGGYRFAGTDVASPIHTSSHYQTFETPFLHELVGGDRNMEQTNLVVTPDGKSWDEVTRDTSYIGNIKVIVSTEEIDPNHDWMFKYWNDWRGRHGSVIFDAFNKDFAIAYDRIICLVGGHYNFYLQFWINDGISSSEWAQIRINNERLVQTYQHDTSEMKNVSCQATGFLQRGDYVQLYGATRSNEYEINRFEITKLEK